MATQAFGTRWYVCVYDVTVIYCLYCIVLYCINTVLYKYSSAVLIYSVACILFFFDKLIYVYILACLRTLFL
jgi:hypothetical protein